jgi:uncharacterized damage-inducible protein DinB
MDFLATARRQMLAGQLQDARERLLESYAGLSNEEMQQAGVCGEWSVAHILSHIASWDRATLNAFKAMLEGERDPFLDLDDAEIEEFNAQGHAAAQNTTPDEAITELLAAREELVTFLRGVDNKVMFAPAPGDEHADLSMAACITVLVNHDEEHADMIDEWRERLSS